MATVHPFEKAGLGVAPFRCVGVRENWFEIPGVMRKPGGSCKFCGTGILYEYMIVSSDSKEFVVGCDCVMKTGGDVKNFDQTRKDHQRAQRRVRSESKRAQRQAQWEAEKLVRDAERQEAALAWKAANVTLVNALIEYTGSSKFLLSMKDNLANWGSLTERQVEATDSALKAEQRTVASEFVGDVGQRVKNVKVRVTKALTVGYVRFGYTDTPRVLITLETEEGNQLTWWTNHHETVSTEFEPASFTVKEHTVYNGAKQTVVQRVAFK